MSYSIDAFLGPASELEKWKAQLASAVVFPLTEQLGLMPLTGQLVEDLCRVLGVRANSEQDLAELWGARASKNMTLAFISAEYFGGDGEQSAVVWANGEVVQAKVTINKALRLLGVRAKFFKDRFDTVGLGRYRTTESWAAAALPLQKTQRGTKGCA